ncbi:MAG TPA: cyclase family protein [Methanocorpusculum sp.]|nr:cyclase family protein [Methanocorpusculum sp.]
MTGNHRIYDITRTISSDMYVYPGDPKYTISPVQIGEYTISKISLGTHTGTHIDAPIHYLSNGIGIDTVPLDDLILQRTELRSFNKIGYYTTKSVLFRSGITDFSSSEYPQISMDTAKDLIDAGVSVVGCDTPSIGNDDVHRLLLSSGVIIIELLDFTSVLDGFYSLIALPMKIKGADAAPSRVILIDYDTK